MAFPKKRKRVEEEDGAVPAEEVRAVVCDPDAYLDLCAMQKACEKLCEGTVASLVLRRRAPFLACCGETEGLEHSAAAGHEFVLHSGLRWQACRESGSGWVAACDLPAGCTVLAERPLANYFDKQMRCPDAGRAVLSRNLAEKLRERGRPLLELLERLHPPLEEATGARLERDKSCTTAWSRVPWVSVAQRRRLERALALNVFVVATADEQLCFSRKWTHLSGAGLYLLGAGFNHSCEPNVTRWSLGDIVIMRTNREVSAGTQLCFSYMSVDQLQAPLAQRDTHLDFKCTCSRCTSERAARVGGKRKRRTHANDSECDVAATVVADTRRRLLEALGCMHRGDFAGAQRYWGEAALLHAQSVVPFEDAVCRNALQAALCAAAKDHDSAQNGAFEWLDVALRVHAVAFGRGVGFFAKRYERELHCDLAQVWLGAPFRHAEHARLQAARRRIADELTARAKLDEDVEVIDAKAPQWVDVQAAIAIAVDAISVAGSIR